MGYSPPEAVTMQLEGVRTWTTQFSIDMWSFGVIAFELLTGTSVLPHGQTLVTESAKTARGAPFPWEDTTAPMYPSMMRKLGFMHDSLLLMLKRNPLERPLLREVITMWRRQLRQETLALTAAARATVALPRVLPM